MRRHPQTEQGAGSEPKRIRVPELDTCNFLEGAINPAFEPNGVLLRRVFFINEVKTRYVSVGFYPTQN
jgi:hypothetical protein